MSRGDVANGSTNDTVRTHLVTRHPLQPFSPRYFGAGQDPRLFSYARDYCEGARALHGQRSTVPPFVSGPLPLDAMTSREVSIDALARFFENPARAFLHNRLSLYLGSDSAAVDDREPLALDTLERWKLGTGLLERRVDGEGIQEALPSLRASGALPPAALGTCVVDGLDQEITAIASVTRQLQRGEDLEACRTLRNEATRRGADPPNRRWPQALEPLVVDEDLDGTRITGVVRDLWPAGQVRYQFSKLGGRHEIGIWIRHLVLNWLQPQEYPRVSYLAGRPQAKEGATAIRFRPVENAGGILRELLRFYWLGQTLPLLLFEKASRAYVEQLRRQPGAETAALKKARAAFRGGPFTRGDGMDDYVRQVFGTANPLDPGFRFGAGPADATDALPGFASLALQVFGPLLDHREEVT